MSWTKEIFELRDGTELEGYLCGNTITLFLSDKSNNDDGTSTEEEMMAAMLATDSNDDSWPAENEIVATCGYLCATTYKMMRQEIFTQLRARCIAI